jgi:hypothetical protein
MFCNYPVSEKLTVYEVAMCSRVESSPTFPLAVSFPPGVEVSSALSSFKEEVAQLLRAPTPNFVHVERVVRQEYEKDHSIQGSVDDAVKSFMKNELSDSQRELYSTQKKWVDAGFDEGVLQTDPEGASFAVETGVIHTILMFQKAADTLEGDPITIQIRDGKAYFLVNGEYQPLEAFKDRIQYSKDEKRFVGWNFIHPQGFVEKDDTSFDTLYPIAKLTPEAYARIAAQANTFWQRREEVDAGQEKKFILQVMTTGRTCIPHTWWGQNIDDHTPEHSSSRLIGPDGSVYSFGTKMARADAEFVTQPQNLFTTAVSYVPAPDYEEPKPAEEKRVTFIPITEQRFEDIRRYVVTASHGFAFNFGKANCAHFVQSLMGLAGVQVDIKMTITQFLYGILPSLENIPVVGRPMAKVAAAVTFVTKPLLDLLSAMAHATPQFIRHIWSKIVDFAMILPRTIGAVFINVIVMTLMGADKTRVPEGRAFEAGGSGELALPAARSCLQWKDLFDPDAFFLYHAFKLRLWQLAQKSTVLYRNPECGFTCIDPQKGVVAA